MPHERELKIQVVHLGELAGKVRSAGGEHVGAFLQTDRFYDTPDGDLRRRGSALRIRTEQRLDLPAGAGQAAPRPLITYKGPRQAAGRVKVRMELQTRLDDVEAMAGILDACGLRQVLAVEKRRESYRLGRCQVELDELPLLGCFVEIEGPDEQAISAVQEALGIEGQPIADSYLQLLCARCPDGRTCGGYTFQRCSACPNRPPATRAGGL